MYEWTTHVIGAKERGVLCRLFAAQGRQLQKTFAAALKSSPSLGNAGLSGERLALQTYAKPTPSRLPRPRWRSSAQFVQACCACVDRGIRHPHPASTKRLFASTGERVFAKSDIKPESETQPGGSVPPPFRILSPPALGGLCAEFGSIPSWEALRHHGHRSLFALTRLSKAPKTLRFLQHRNGETEGPGHDQLAARFLGHP